MDEGNKLNVKKARKILGHLADNVSDEQIEQDIKVVDIIRNLFFEKYVTLKKQPINYNKS